MALSTTLQMARTLAPAAFAALHRDERVDRLAGLADGDHQIVGEEDRLAVAHLARELDDGGHAGDLLDPVAARHGGVVARPAGDEVDALELPRELGRDAHLVREHVARRRDRSRPRSVASMTSGCSWISLSMKCL